MPCSLLVVCPGKLLMSEAILTSDALIGAAKENVPEWRDSARGRKLQLTMMDDAYDRCFNLDVHGELFKDGDTWAHFSRVKPMVLQALILEHGNATGWPPLIVNFWNEIRKGEHDAEILIVSQTVPSTLDLQVIGQQAATISLLFKTLRAKSLALKQLASIRVLDPPVASIATGDQGGEDHVLDQQSRDQEMVEFTGVRSELGAEHRDVDVTQQVDSQGKLTPAQKVQLVKDLNAQEDKKAADKTLTLILEAAADIWRFSVKVVPNADEAVSYMQSEKHGGLQARMCLVDFTMWSNCLTSSKSRLLAKEPSAEVQTTLAGNLKMIPKTPIIGHGLLRFSNCDGYTLLGHIAKTLPHKRFFLVPIAVPGAYQRTMKSGASRCTGPSDETQDRSGVSFFMRTIGHAKGSLNQKMNRKKDDDDVEEVDDEEEECDEDDMVGEAGSPEGVRTAMHQDVEILPAQDLRTIFGEQVPDAHQVLFQHTSRITAEATFANKHMRVMVQKTARGEPSPYRKGQVHPTVFHEVFRSSLRCANVPLTGRECAVILTGGTPDAIVGALMAGYKYVIFVANSVEEANMMTLPSAEELIEGKTDLTRYPDACLIVLAFNCLGLC